MVATITSNLHLADAPGNLRLAQRTSGLPRDSVLAAVDDGLRLALKLEIRPGSGGAVDGAISGNTAVPMRSILLQ